MVCAVMCNETKTVLTLNDTVFSHSTFKTHRTKKKNPETNRTTQNFLYIFLPLVFTIFYDFPGKKLHRLLFSARNFYQKLNSPL